MTQQREPAPRVVVVGAGFAGLAAVRRLARSGMRTTLIDRNVYSSLVERAPALLTPFHPALRDYARRQLVRRGVDVRLGAAIREIAPGRVILTDGSILSSDVTVWAAGVAAAAPVSNWNLPQGAGGRILIGADLRVTGHQEIFAIGDVSLTEDQALPQLAQPALQMGKHAANQVRRLAQGQATVPFRYRDKGIMATIGYRSAVVELPHRVRFRGTLAWLAWLALHIITLLGGRNRISALVNMSSRYLTWRHGGGLIVGDGLSTAPASLSGAAESRVTGPAGTGPARDGSGAG
jgi:NADH:ubiquinone reductase (H+-translocating)